MALSKRTELQLRNPMPRRELEVIEVAVDD